MADLKTTLKQAWLKTMESVGTAASNIASNTRLRLDEMNLINRRREILSELGNRTYEMWQKDVPFPSPLKELLEELSHTDEALNALRAKKLAGVSTSDAQKNQAAPEAAANTPAAEEVTYTMPPTDEGTPGETAKPLGDSIEQLVNGVTDRVDDLVNSKEAQEAGAKMQGVLDAIEQHVSTFGESLGKSIDSMADTLTQNESDHHPSDDESSEQP